MHSSAESDVWKPTTKLNIYWMEMRLARERLSVQTAKVGLSLTRVISVSIGMSPD